MTSREQEASLGFERRNRPARQPDLYLDPKAHSRFEGHETGFFWVGLLVCVRSFVRPAAAHGFGIFFRPAR